jgi:hypothetical protein
MKVANNHQNYIKMNKKSNKRNKNLIFRKFNYLPYKIVILLIRVIKNNHRLLWYLRGSIRCSQKENKYLFLLCLKNIRNFD